MRHFPVIRFATTFCAWGAMCLAATAEEAVTNLAVVIESAVSAASADVRVEARGGMVRDLADPEMAGTGVYDAATTVLHGGMMTADETWTADKVHVVRNWVTVPEDVALTIEEGAVVKFAEATGIRVMDRGELYIWGEEESHAVLTVLADDARGGDTDLRSETPVWRPESFVSICEYAVLDYNEYVEPRYGDWEGFGYVNVGIAQGLELDGSVRVPLFLEDCDGSAVELTWQALPGTATYPEDLNVLSGIVDLVGLEDGTYLIEVPLVKDWRIEGMESFKLVISGTCGVNNGRTEATVLVLDPQEPEPPESAVSEASADIRVEARDGFARDLAAADAEGRTVVNPATVALEGGQLASSVTWSPDKVHVVRNWVNVQRGATLTIAAGTIVKFSPYAGIRVEDGGELVVQDTEAARVVFTVDSDDTIGGDTDGVSATPTKLPNFPVTLCELGTFTENGFLETHYMDVSQWGSVSVEPVTKTLEQCAAVAIPVYIDTSRTGRFSVKWRASDGTATFGGDYLLAEGELTWSGSSEGTKYILIPLQVDTVTELPETFAVTLHSPCGVNLAGTSGTITVTDGALELVGDDYRGVATSADVRVDARAGLGGHLAHGTERIGSPSGATSRDWDTTAEPDGWQTLTDGAASAEVLVRNAATVRIEGGRLTGNATWANDAVHVVRDWVTVPTNVTLRITQGTVVKFTEYAGIKVEDGGKLDVAGAEANRVVFTVVEDDLSGGNTDLRETEPELAELPPVSLEPAAVFADNSYLRVNHMDVPQWGTVSIQDAKALEVAGSAYVSVTIDTSRKQSFSVDWEAVAGTATYPGDYTLASGTVVWTGSSQGTKEIMIPLVSDAVAEPQEAFTVRLMNPCGVNIARGEATVTITDSPLVIDLEDIAVSDPSADARVDARTSFGGRLAHGIERLGTPDGCEADDWDTTWENDGWVTKTSGGESVDVAVVNAADVAVEYGMLAENTVWSNDAVHVVRDWVTVPSGVTLTVAAGTVVKFTEFAGIRVEDGGRLAVADGPSARVVFTVTEDDACGGDVDMRTETPVASETAPVYLFPNAKFTENGHLSIRYLTMTQWGNVSVQDALTVESTGTAYVPVTLDTTRTAPFRVDWEAVDGTAKLGEDFTVASGTLAWSSSSEGRKFIEVPLSVDGIRESPERFTVRLVGSCGVNIDRREATVTVTDNDVEFPAEGSGQSTAAGTVRVDARTSLGGRLAHGVERVGTRDGSSSRIWDTAQETDGWKTLSDGGESLEVLVRNDASVAVEGGRLAGNETWGPDRVHVVRDWVVVPAGVMLTITAGTVVKFTEYAGIHIEDNGKVNVTGSSDARVVFTVPEDDAKGGDTDMGVRSVAKLPGEPVYWYPSGTFTENGWLEIHNLDMPGWGTVAIHSAQAYEENGFAWVPITVTGTRNASFAVDWQAFDGTAKYGEDYTARAGTVVWSGTSQGIGHAQVPLAIDDEHEGFENFTVRIAGTCGMNVELDSATVEVFDSAITRQVAATGTGRVEQRTNLVARLVKGEWPLPYGAWQTNGTDTAKVRVTAQRRDGSGDEVVLVEKSPAATGVLAWDTTGLAVGWWTLRHEELDAGGAVLEAFAGDVNIQQNVIAHEGGMTTNEVWAGHGVTHYVAGDFTVWQGRNVEIEPGAVVKFEPGTGMTVESNAAIRAYGTEAEPIAFTSLHDDVRGGDLDGEPVVPQTGDWEGISFADGQRSEMYHVGWYYGRSAAGTFYDLGGIDSLEVDEAWFGACFGNDGDATRSLALRYDGDGVQTFGGKVSGNVAVAKTGNGTVEFAASQSYTGGTAVESGTLRLAHQDSGSFVGIDGTAYPTNVSQALWDNRFLTHRWSFNGTLEDSVGGQTAVTNGTKAALFTEDGEAIRLVGGSRGTCWIDLGEDVISCGEPVTIEMWAKQDEIQYSSRVFDFGNDNRNYLYLAWTYGTTESRDLFGYYCNGSYKDIYGGVGGFERGTKFHISVRIEHRADGRFTVTYAKRSMDDGRLLGQSSCEMPANWSLGAFGREHCFLGHSNITGCNDAAAEYDEVRIWNAALSDAQLEANAIAGPDSIPDVRTNIGGAYSIGTGSTLDLNGGMLVCTAIVGVGTVANGTLVASGEIAPAVVFNNVEVEKVSPPSDHPEIPNQEVDAYMAKYPELAQEAGYDRERFLKLPSAGKVDASGNQMYVWQDIIAGTDPTDVNDKFRIVDIVFVEGKFKVIWSPDLNENGTKRIRRYTEFGRKDLGESEKWTDMKDVDPAEKNDYKFRKVTVDMP